MGSCVSLSISLDQSVNKITRWLEEKVVCIQYLEKNLSALETTMVDLKAKQNDLLRKLQREEDRGLERLDIVQVWLTRVYSLETKVNDLLSVKDVQLQRLCLCGFCVKSFSTCGYGKSVFLTLREVEKLKSEDFEVIAEQPLIPMVEERQLQPIIVGQEKMLEQAWKHLMKDEVGIMGMFGMGGVGKTTLLTQIYNKFNKDKSGFDYVIWIVVSQDLNIEKIQDEITQKVGLSRDTSEKGIHLFNFLRRKRFVLFLDDIWEKVDLAEIGVPDPRTQKGCKLVFSTRSQSVCSHMGVEDPMEVQCLGDNEAFDLFEKKVGQVTLGSDIGIPELARIVAKKCCGLPLALNVIGETMSCKKTTQEWRHAIHVLNSYAAEFSGMEDKILPLLKYSYDNLKGDHLKSCLLYCALFPEDYKIVKEDLIEYWICEGIIDGSEGIEKAENEGYDIVGSLVQSSLLMEGVNRRHYVTMHDVVREMALWIASDLGKQKEAFIVRAGVGLQDIPKVKNWAVVKKMSLMENKINHLVGSRKCLELTTLLLRGLSLQSISSEFFMSMRKLTVLDLSRNERLRELSEGISKLVSLQYLNLASTGIYHLPKGLQELIKLIHLDLENTWELKSIDGISRVRNLKVLKLKDSYFTWDLNTVQELEALEHLEILTKEFEDLTSPVRQKILSSQKLMSCEQSLRVIRLYSFGITLPETMDKLQNFEIFHCSISQIKMGRRCSFLSLVEVLTFLKFAPNLRILNVSCSGEIEDIINTEKALKVDNSWILPFLRLKELILRDLPLLKNIFCSPLPFPCLEMITIKECPNLKKLPLDSKSGKHGDNEIMITCHEEWIKSVEWEDEATKTRFLSSL